MSNVGPRRPPRFVPTLTAVVDLDAPPPLAEPELKWPQAGLLDLSPGRTEGAALETGDAAARSAALPANAPAEAPLSGAPAPVMAPSTSPTAPRAVDARHAAAPSMVAIRPDDVVAIEEELLHRVLQRVDLRLEEALTDVVSEAVQQQLDAMIPVIRARLEGRLRTLIGEALAHELDPAEPRVFAGGRAPSLG